MQQTVNNFDLREKCLNPIKGENAATTINICTSSPHTHKKELRAGKKPCTDYSLDMLTASQKKIPIKLLWAWPIFSTFCCSLAEKEKVKNIIFWQNTIFIIYIAIQLLFLMEEVQMRFTPGGLQYNSYYRFLLDFFNFFMNLL